MTFTLPDLPYAYDALEPYIDEETLHLHHDKHHQTYVNNFNAALEGHPEYADKSAEWLVTHVNELPKEIQTAVRNNGGGTINHTFYWEIMGPNGGTPKGEVKDAIEAAFGSLEKFQEEFKKAATGRFGSGWAWLVLNNGKLEIISTANQDSPLTEGMTPILTIDVWEHAYYLKYKNLRPKYVDAFWHVVNWDKMNELYKAAK